MVAVDLVSTINEMLIGRTLLQIKKGDYIWWFSFDEQVTLSIECPWRILAPGIALADGDHEQKFGLPAPLNGEREAHRLLFGKPITRVVVGENTGDLTIVFPGNITLELLNLSAGYEAWQLRCGGRLVVAQGGGNVALHSESKT